MRRSLSSSLLCVIHLAVAVAVAGCGAPERDAGTVTSPSAVEIAMPSARPTRSDARPADGAQAVPAEALLLPPLRDCLARTPKAAGFRTITDFASGDGELRVAWTLTEVWVPANDPLAAARMKVGLDLTLGKVTRALPLGAHEGRLYARELSVCRDAPHGKGACAAATDWPSERGVVSEVSVHDFMGYSWRGSAWWMLVRTPTSMVLLASTTWDGLTPKERGLCTPDLWQRTLEVELAPSVRVIEEVRTGDPPAAIDCTRMWAGDGRCTG